MNIVYLDASTIGEVPNMREITALGYYTSYHNTSSEQRIERLKDADIVILNKVVIDKAVMDACPRLKLICEAATGTDNIDIAYAQTKGITVKNVAGYSSQSVAQTTFALILQLLTHTDYYNDYVKSGLYSASSLFTHFGPPIGELYGKQFGIIGLGAIGSRVATIAEAFGAKVSYYSSSGKNNNILYPRLELDQLLKQSDVVSIHAPLNKQTFNLIDAAKLQLMKNTALLINMGRGGIVNEAALAAALDKGALGGAGLDVLQIEPLPANSPLLHIKNKDRLLILPHVAWTSIEARTELVSRIAENIRQWIAETREG